MIDTHTHLTEEPLISEIDGVIKRAKEHNIDKFVIPGYNPDSWCRSRELSSLYKEINFAVGLHPLFIHEENRERLEKELAAGGVIAVGEIGLDYYNSRMERVEQIRIFKYQLNLAIEYDLPVIIHCRKAYDDLLIICKDFPQINGVIHSCSCSAEQVKPFLELGYFISFSGTVTRNRNLKVKKLAVVVPLDKMLVETDSPFIGTKNHPVQSVEPAHMPEIIESMAEIKGKPSDIIAENAENNAMKLFKL